ncbi:hypothetical protein FGADI_9842 [Fusarium gaditjirri]|uniref:Uncharacterized protein n=1 Tax=Fusarium gaditjirri TaxID=282569 RepID=A0A8H4SYX9_9HYPO|nr:hypothetical protein FGADI_9842 [Fusarium gaditjirri]
MPLYSYIQVPREGNPTSNVVHQSTTYSEQMNAYLREDHKDMPWHIIDSIVLSSTDTSESNPNTNASHNPAIQGSANQTSGRSHMPPYFARHRPARSPQRTVVDSHSVPGTRTTAQHT